MAGKGDRDRTSNRDAFRRGYDAVDWTKKTKVTFGLDNITLFDLPDYKCPVCKDTGITYTWEGVLIACKCQL